MKRILTKDVNLISRYKMMVDHSTLDLTLRYGLPPHTEFDKRLTRVWGYGEWDLYESAINGINGSRYAKD